MDVYIYDWAAVGLAVITMVFICLYILKRVECDDLLSDLSRSENSLDTALNQNEGLKSDIKDILDKGEVLRQECASVLNDRDVYKTMWQAQSRQNRKIFQWIDKMYKQTTPRCEKCGKMYRYPKFPKPYSDFHCPKCAEFEAKLAEERLINAIMGEG